MSDPLAQIHQQRLGQNAGRRRLFRPVDLPLFRMKDDRPGPTTMVYKPCSEPGSRR